MDTTRFSTACSLFDRIHQLRRRRTVYAGMYMTTL
jgi:hypothetical protein